MSIRLENVKVERQFVLRWSSYQCICSELLDSQFIHQTWASERARYLAERKGKKERPRARIKSPLKFDGKLAVQVLRWIVSSYVYKLLVPLYLGRSIEKKKYNEATSCLL